MESSSVLAIIFALIMLAIGIIIFIIGWFYNTIMAFIGAGICGFILILVCLYFIMYVIVTYWYNPRVEREDSKLKIAVNELLKHGNGPIYGTTPRTRGFQVSGECHCRRYGPPKCANCNGTGSLPCPEHAPVIGGTAFINVNSNNLKIDHPYEIARSIVCMKCQGGSAIACYCKIEGHPGTDCHDCANTGIKLIHL
jgi:hypothetical protein